jgi:endonuclease/exonuclease/phosphatase family metal-dependent hydrolase
MNGSNLARGSLTVVWAFVMIMGCGCRTAKTVILIPDERFNVLTYNVNWGAARGELAIETIRASGADIVCLQETTAHWEQAIRRDLAKEYPFAEFRNSPNRAGGGLAFLSKTRAQQVAYIPSETGWFDGWIMKFETAVGPVQIINVHLRPPVSDRGRWISGYFSTRDDRVREMQRFFSKRQPHIPTLVVGDFNDGENSSVIKWLKSQRMANALPLFDSSTPTWRWQTGLITLKRRMDHILFSPELQCYDARVVQGGASDHFPVEAIFGTR